MPDRPELGLLAIAAIDVIGIVVLAALRVPIPDVLQGLALLAVGGGAGVASPRVVAAGRHSASSGNDVSETPASSSTSSSTGAGS